MPAINPRITITLQPSVHAALRRLSGLTGSSQSALVGELLLQSLPVFERLINVMEAANQAKGALSEEVASSLGRAQEKIERQLGIAFDNLDDGLRPLLDQAEAVSRRAPKGAAGARGARSATRATAVADGLRGGEMGGSTPVPVTRGSGTPRGGKTTGKKGTGTGVRSGKL